ncbi:hypothetical protein GCM10020256_32340 [Streptomyces thermocoprophilus]
MAGLERWFDDGRIFSSQDVGRGKPAPDLFLYAAEKMGVAPERCVVVEDSPLGVQAAVAAGMDVLGFTAMTPAERLQDAGQLFLPHGRLGRPARLTFVMPSSGRSFLPAPPARTRS